MSRFDDCVNEHGLQGMIDAQYGRYGRFTAESADTILEVVRLEVREPGPAALINLASQLAFTWMNEAVFNLRPPPNKNGYPDDFIKWDIGPGQLNVYWLRKTAEIGEIPAINEAAVFGSFHPDRFDGDPTANLRAVCQVLLAIKAGRDKPGISESLIETQCVHYCGPKARAARRESFRKYFGLFREFFICYEALA